MCKADQAASADNLTSGCLVQTYSNNHGGFTGHMFKGMGVIKAVGLRLNVWGSLIAGIGLAGGGGH